MPGVGGVHCVCLAILTANPPLCFQQLPGCSSRNPLLFMVLRRCPGVRGSPCPFSPLNLLTNQQSRLSSYCALSRSVPQSHRYRDRAFAPSTGKQSRFLRCLTNGERTAGPASSTQGPGRRSILGRDVGRSERRLCSGRSLDRFFQRQTRVGKAGSVRLGQCPKLGRR
jgi:hypothetical protein